MSRKNISLHKEIDKRAAAIIAKRGFAGLSDMIAALVREEFERRGLQDPNTPESLREEPATYKTGEVKTETVSLARKHQIDQELADALKPPPEPPLQP